MTITRYEHDGITLTYDIADTLTAPGEDPVLPHATLTGTTVTLPLTLVPPTILL